MDIDSIFEGGPYNGNSFIVPDDVHSYSLYTPVPHGRHEHIYVRSGPRRFIYVFSSRNSVPQSADTLIGYSDKGVQWRESSTGEDDRK